MFHKKGTIRIPKTGLTEDDVLAVVLDAGAEDLIIEDETFDVATSLESFEPVKKALDAANIKIEEAELTMVPENTVRVEGQDAERVLKLMEILEDHDDTAHVYANFDIDEKVLSSFAG